MAEALKILGQVQPASTTSTSLYLTPTARQTVVSSIVVANVTTAAATYRIHATVSSGTAFPLFYDVYLAANTSVVIQAGIALAAGSQLSVTAGTVNALVFTAFGQELS
jgi:hypothetical protein